MDQDHYFPALADVMRLLAAPADLESIEQAPESPAERVTAEDEPL